MSRPTAGLPGAPEERPNASPPARDVPPAEDAEAFDRVYHEEHLPYASPRLKGATGVASQRVVSPTGNPGPYYAISKVSFPDVGALIACAGSRGAVEALQHATSISSGGPPTIVMVSDDWAR